jgi:type IV pilus assembly protein PilM
MGFLSNLFSSNTLSRSNSAIGVDIGSSSLKVVELEERSGVLTLVTYGEVQLGPYAGKPIGGVVQLTAKQEQEALVDAIRESAVKANDAVFAMPLSASFISTATLGSSGGADIGAMVRVEARKLIPASLNEVTLDWAELSQTDTHQRVLLAAIQNSAIDRFNILEQFAGFADAQTEIECFSTNRAVSTTENCAVFDFGAQTTKMYLLSGGILNRMHRVNVGGEAVTKALMKKLNLTFEEAEMHKQQPDSEGKYYTAVHDTYQQVYGRAMREFSQVIQRHTSETDEAFQAAEICGGASRFAAAPGLVKELFSANVEYIRPFRHVAYPTFMGDVIEEIGPYFTASLGAALRPFE